MDTDVAAERTSARDRLLAAANELFYAEGVHTVGVDRIVAHAGVAKATLYTLFGNKEGLVREYLTARHDRTRERMNRELATRYANPRDRLLGVFEVQGQSFGEPGFRGCAFVGANAEFTDGTSIDEVTAGYRDWLWSLFLDLAREAGVADPESLAGQLVLLFDGAGISAWMDHNPDIAQTSRSLAATLIDAAIPNDENSLRNGKRASPPS
jgi:AcrR family transcriptional regulator